MQLLFYIAALSPQESAVGSMQPFHTEFIRNMIDDSLSDFREQVHRDIVNVQVEMLRQFQIQQVSNQNTAHKYTKGGERSSVDLNQSEIVTTHLYTFLL